MSRLASHELERALQDGARVAEGVVTAMVGDDNVEQLGGGRHIHRNQAIQQSSR